MPHRSRVDGWTPGLWSPKFTDEGKWTILPKNQDQEPNSKAKF